MAGNLLEGLAADGGDALTMLVELLEGVGRVVEPLPRSLKRERERETEKEGGREGGSERERREEE
jgi:hypothetical protein